MFVMVYRKDYLINYFKSFIIIYKILSKDISIVRIKVMKIFLSVENIFVLIIHIDVQMEAVSIKKFFVTV